MKLLSKEARQKLDDYLGELRSTVRASRTANAEEVESEVMQHIENELADKLEPISLSDLESVLTKLGGPRQWIPEEEMSAWRRFALHLQKGPEDYRLAYVSLAILVLGFLFAHRLGFPLFVLASFILSRAAVSAADAHGGLGTRRWLVYPSLLIVYIILAALLLFLPPMALDLLVVGLIAYTHAAAGQGLSDPSWSTLIMRHGPGGLGVVLFAVPALGLWWTILGALMMSLPNIVRATFRPFADRATSRWGRLLLKVGLALFVIGAALLVMLIA